MTFGQRNCRICKAPFIAHFWNESSCSPACKRVAERETHKNWRKSPKGLLSRRAARKRYKQRTPRLEEF